jgi:TolB protein
MMKSMRIPHFLAIATLLFSGFLSAQQPVSGASGIFQGSTDIGTAHKGSTIYVPATGDYRLTGSGADLWGAADEFHFAWVRLSGDVTLTADVRFPKSSEMALRKAVLMVRQSLDPGSAYADIAIHGDGHITLQYRKVSGGNTEDTTSTEHGSTRLRIERKGNQYTVSAGAAGEKLTALPPITITLNDPVYVGIGVCPHNADGFEEAIFSNVKIEQSAANKK